MRVYTRGGDKGKTGIHGGGRVDKDDIRIEANGSIDELNATIGVVRAFLPVEHEWEEMLYRIQQTLMAVMSHVATPSVLRGQNPNVLPEDIVTFCEGHIDRMAAEIGEDGYFILPGGNVVSAHCHLARTVARRAERQLWALNKKDQVSPVIMEFMNRLSDLFFIMARYEMFKIGTVEEKWQSFAYKRI